MKSIATALLGNLFFLAVLLVSAGRWDYWQGWVYTATGLTMSALTRLVLRKNPELAAERAAPAQGAEGWDKKLLAAGFVLTLAMLVVAGLDSGRAHLRPIMPLAAFFVGLALDLAGMAVFLASMNENRFFTAVVRIQREREHTVCTTGPYRFVRHPGYAGMIIGTLGIPLLLMSAWSAIPALLFVGTVALRTRLEDATLRAELAGYDEYCRKTPYRLVPGVW